MFDFEALVALHDFREDGDSIPPDYGQSLDPTVLDAPLKIEALHLTVGASAQLRICCLEEFVERRRRAVASGSRASVVWLCGVGAGGRHRRL